MAVAFTSLATLTALKSALNISTADSSEDTYLEKLIDRATAWIESETGRRSPDGKYGLKARGYNGASGNLTLAGADTIPNEDYVYFSGATTDQGGDTLVESGNGVFHLPAWPVLANSVLTFGLAVLSDQGSAVSGGQEWDTTTYAEWDDYVVNRERGIIRLLGGPFAWGHRNYRVTMAAGYKIGSAQPYVPDDLEQLCIELARMLYRDSKNVRSESMGGVSRSFGTFAEDPFIASVLGRYRRYSV